MNGDPDRIVEMANEDCPLCDGEGIQLRERPTCRECGDETCEHGLCGDPHCKNFCICCQNAHEAEQEARYQRDVAGPLLGLDEEAQC
jgi:hypothetical protein